MAKEVETENCLFRRMREEKERERKEGSSLPPDSTLL